MFYDMFDITIANKCNTVYDYIKEYVFDYALKESREVLHISNYIVWYCSDMRECIKYYNLDTDVDDRTRFAKFMLSHLNELIKDINKELVTCDKAIKSVIRLKVLGITKRVNKYVCEVLL